MYELAKKTLQESGELMVKISDGETFELHLHNVEFDDTNSMITIDTGTGKYWINGDEIIYFWIHRVKD